MAAVDTTCPDTWFFLEVVWALWCLSKSFSVFPYIVYPFLRSQLDVTSWESTALSFVVHQSSAVYP